MNIQYKNKNKMISNKLKNTINEINIDTNCIKKKVRKTRIKRQCINKEIFIFLMEEIKKSNYAYKKTFNIILLNSLLYLTGCRIGEILLLNKVNITSLFNNGKHSAYCPKTKSLRTIYLNNDGKNFILNNLGLNEIDFYTNLNEKGLVNLYDNKLDKRTAYNWMDKYFQLFTEKYYNTQYENKNNEIAFNFHSFRVNLINNLCRNCENLDEVCKVSRLIGHKNLNTTFIYWRENKIDEKEINDKLNKALNLT